MLVNKDNALEILKSDVTDFLYPFKMGGEFNIVKYKKLILTLNDITRIYKSEELIPKKLLSEIYLTAEGISNESLYIKNFDLGSMAKEIMEKYYMLLSGESVDDPKPEVGIII